jgi:hypothetical protein
MTEKEMMKLADQANLPMCHLSHPKALKRFAKLIKEYETEKIKLMVEHYFDYAPSKQFQVAYGNIVDAIDNKEHENT